MSQNLRNIKANAIANITQNITGTMNISGNLNPTANVTYNLGNTTNRWKDLFLSNSTIYLGDTTFNSANIFPFNLVIAPEVLTINVAAPFAGDDITWLWNWQTSTLPYARTTIVNSAQVSVPLYKQGTYQINNFANQQTGNMTQRHGAHLKWVDGAGLDNLVNWAVESGNVSFNDSNINSGATTNVQRINVTVPANITVPTLVTPNIANYMTVSCVNSGVYTFSGNGDGDNRTLGPLYRGGTYTIHLDSSCSTDPFYFTTDNGTNFTVDGYFGEYTTGVTGSRNDGTTGKTTIKIVVDSTAPDVLFYQSSKTSSKRGAIVIKDLAVETNINGNYILYFQHGGEGHKTPVEIRPIPSLVNQMCVVYDATVGQFVPQDLATYVENTPSFKNKIREVAGTATLIAPNGVAVVPTVLVVEDTSYLPLINNKEGDIAFDSYYDTIYVWQGGAWRNSKATSIPGANVVGAVANATYATTSGTSSTSNAVAGANVTGQVGNSLIAGTVYTASQPNITSVGTLSDLSVSGNITLGGNLTVTGTTTLINSTTVSINDINILLANNATTASQANGGGITINGANASMNYISSTNSFTFSHKIVADGSLLTSITGANVTGQVNNALVSGTVYTSSQPNITSVGTLTSLSVTGNVTSGNANLGNLTTSNYFTGNGSLLSSLTGGNVTGQVGNALIAGTVYTASQPNITSLGTLSSLNVTANIVAGNVNAGNLLTANYHSGNGSLLSAIAGANVTGQVGNALLSGTVYTAAQPNITSVGTLTSLAITGNVTSGNASLGNLTTSNYFSGNGSLLTGITASTAGTVTASAQPNITSVGTLTSLTVTGNITSGNANLGNTLTANYFTGNSVSANNVSVSGDALSYSVYLNGASYVTVPSTSSNSLFGSGNYTIEFWCKTTDTSWEIFAPESGVGPALIIAGSFIFQYQYGVAGIITTSATAITDGQWHHVAVVRNGSTVTVYYDGVSKATATNSTDYSGQNQTYDIGYGNQSAGRYLDGYLSNFRILNGTALYTSNFTPPTSPLTNIANTKLLTFQNSTLIDNSTGARTLGSSGTYVLGSSVIPFSGYGPGGVITATGNITGSYFIGNGSTITYITGGNVTGQVGNALISGTVYTNAQPNITSVGTLTSLTVTANITAGNINAGNLLTANYHSGNGSLLSSIAGANVTGQVGNALIATTVTASSQPNITSHGSLIGLTVSNATGIVDFTTTANVTLGNVSNLHISGGSSGQYLQTNGSGTLTWATASSGGVTAARSIINSYVFGS